MKSILFALCVLVLSGSCKHANTTSNNHTDTTYHAQKMQSIIRETTEPVETDTTANLKLQYGFKIIAGEVRHLQKYKNSFFELWHNDIKLYTDTVYNYELKGQSYPVLINLYPGIYELLVEFDNNPNKNLQFLLRIEHDKITRRDTLATFTGKSEVINGMLVHSGKWDNSEEWDEKGVRYITFDPDLYYKFTPDGVRLDSALTRLRNREKYGRVDAFEKGYQIGFPIDTNGNIDKIYKHQYRKKISEL